MNLTRLTIVVAVATASTWLAGCSSDGGGDDDAHTVACRTYLLEVGGQDSRAESLLAEAARSGTWDNGAVNAALASVRTAAKDAGLVDHLSDGDFGRFSDLSDATGAAYARANPDGEVGITAGTVSDFRAAVSAARSGCT